MGYGLISWNYYLFPIYYRYQKVMMSLTIYLKKVNYFIFIIIFFIIKTCLELYLTITIS